MSIKEDIYNLAIKGELGKVLRGELFPIATPIDINSEMRPTDHDQLLIKYIYPLIREHGVYFKSIFEHELVKVANENSLGLFCAIQCFYVHVINEKNKETDVFIAIDSISKDLGNSFLLNGDYLHSLEIDKGDLLYDKSYKLTVSGMRILERDYGVDWGIKIP